MSGPSPAMVIGIASLAIVFVILSLVKTALRTLTKVTLRRLADASGPATRAMLAEFLASPVDFILNLQSLIQVSLVGIAVLVTVALASPPRLVGIAVAAAVLAAFALAMEQFFPRFVLAVDREKLLTRLLPAYGLLAPFARLLAWPASFFYSRVLLRREPRGEVSDEEVRAFIDVGEEAGILDATEGKLVESIVDFSETIVREVMTPRVDIVSLDGSRTVAELRDLMLASKHSRVPVYRDRVDNIEGVAYIKDVLAAWRDGKDGERVWEWMKPTLYVPETKSVSSLLKEFQKSRVTFAVVVDEFGGTSGLVTVDDLIEEILGEIRESWDDAPPDAVAEPDGTYLLSGKASVAKLEELFEIDVPDDAAYDTVAGLVFATLGRVPALDEELEYQGLRIKVVGADRHRVNQVRVSRAPGAAAP